MLHDPRRLARNGGPSGQKEQGIFLTYQGISSPSSRVRAAKNLNFFHDLVAKNAPNSHYMSRDFLEATSTKAGDWSDIPFTAFWGFKYLDISHPYAEFLAACASGTLPQVSYVDPRFIDEASATSNDDHPHADIRNGEAFLNQVYTAVTNSPAWPNTVFDHHVR